MRISSSYQSRAPLHIKCELAAVLKRLKRVFFMLHLMLEMYSLQAAFLNLGQVKTVWQDTVTQAKGRLRVALAK